MKRYFCLIIAIVFCGSLLNAQELKSSPQGNEYLKLNGAFEIPSEGSLRNSPAVSMIVSDLNGDGINDLITGRENGISIQMGDINAFAPKTQEAFEAIRDLRFISPFRQEERSIELPISPDFLLSGDFDRDSRVDIIAAAKGGGTIYLIAGDGTGGFVNTREIGLNGKINTMIGGDVNRLDGLPDVIIGVGSEVLIYRGFGDILSREPSRISLANDVETIAIGQLDTNTFTDIAVGNGNQISIISGSDDKNEVGHLPQGFGVRSMVVGDFVPDREFRPEIAALDDSGTIHILSRGDLDTRPVTKKEHLASQVRDYQAKGFPIPQRILKQLSNEDLREPAPLPVSDNQTWSEYDQFFGAVPSALASSNAILTSGRLSNSGEDLIVLDSDNNEINVLPMAIAESETGERVSYVGRRQSVKFRLESSPILAIAGRFNFDGDKDLLVLQSGKAEVSTFLTAPQATFNVTSNGDAPDNNPGNGVCASTLAGNPCTLRAAIMEANRFTGNDTITINSGINITLSTGKADNDGFGDNSASSGDLDIFCSINATEDLCLTPNSSDNNDVTIMGAAGGNTISAGTFAPSSSTGVTTDRVFDIGMDGIFGGGFGGSTGIDVTMSNLTIQSGNVREDWNMGFATANFARGGAIRMDGFGGATRGTLTLTSVTINNNQADHDTGGVFNQFASIAFTSVTATTNIGKAGPGGALAFLASTPATLSVANSTFTSNEARTGPVFAGTALDVDGGAIAANHDSNVGTITNTNFSNNISHDDGGALKAFSGAITVTGGTMSGNTARDDGGAVWGDNDTVSGARFLTLSGVTMQNNRANSDNSGGGDGGAVFRDRGTLNVTNCTIGGVAALQPNNALNGGGIAHAFRAAVTPSNQTTINIDNGSITGNNATTDGGGVFINATNQNAGTPSVLNVGSTTNVAVTENNSNIHGGGIAVSGGVTDTLTRATFSGNDADADNNASGDGGGLYHNNNGGTTTVASTVSFTSNGNGSTTTENGGAIHHSNGTLTLNSPGVSGNDADVQGGGLFVSGGIVNVNGVTFSANTFPLNAAEVRLTGGTTNFSGTVGIPGELSIAGGTLAAGSSTVNLGEDFHFSSGTFTAGTSTFNFNGAAAQQIYGGAVPTFNNLTDSNTAAQLSVNNNANVNGNLTVNANAVLNPAAASVIGGTGTLTGNGTARVTRTAATADFLSQYTITNKTLTNLLVDYVGGAAQVLSGTTYGGLRINNASGVTLSGTATVNGTLTLTAGALSAGTGTLNINNGTLVAGGSITSAPTGTVVYGDGGQIVLAGTYGNLTFSNFNKTLPAGIVGIAGTFTPGSGTPTVIGNTINFNGTAAQTIPVFPYNNLTLNNAAGATLAGNTSVPGVLTLTSGALATGANVLTVTTTGSLARTTGFVNGALRKDFPAAPGAFIFAVGTASGYAPVNVNATAGSGNLTVIGIQGPMPNINGAQAIQRYWQLTGTGITVNLVFNYNQTDVLGTESQYVIHKQLLPSMTNIAVANQCPGSPCVDTVANTGTANGISSFSNWTIAVPLAPTAANVGVSGRVVTANGSGVRNALVTLTDTNGVIRSARTSSFGYYRFDDVRAGETYVASVRSKEYQFTPRTIQVSDELTGVDFIAVE